MVAYTIKEAKQEIKTSIAIYLQKDESGNYVMHEVNRLPFYLQGEPGVGKTEMARQIAEEMKIGFVSLSITHHTRNTVLGLPVIKELPGEGTKYTAYTMSEMIAMVEKKVEEGYAEGILLIDEFACMAESMVAPMLAFLQTKNIGTHHLPEGWVLILCSNPSAYNKSAREFDMAVMDRVRIMEISFSAEELVRYGYEKRFDQDVLEYLKSYPSDAHTCKVTTEGEKIIVTGRGWENLSHCMAGYKKQGQEITKKLIHQFIKSDEIADRFYQFYQTCHAGLKSEQVREVMEGRNLSRYIDLLKDKPYDVKFQAVQMMGNILIRNCMSISDEMDFVNYLTWVRNEAAQEEVSGEEIINNRLSGKKLPEKMKLPDRKLDDMERKAWKCILKMNEDVFPEFSEAVEAYIGIMDDTMGKRQQKISDCAGNALNFAEAVCENGNLTDILVNMLNGCKGFLDIMIRFKNSVWLKYNKRVTGIDKYFSRQAG